MTKRVFQDQFRSTFLIEKDEFLKFKCAAGSRGLNPTQAMRLLITEYIERIRLEDIERFRQ